MLDHDLQVVLQAAADHAEQLRASEADAASSIEAAQNLARARAIDLSIQQTKVKARNRAAA